MKTNMLKPLTLTAALLMIASSALADKHGPRATAEMIDADAQVVGRADFMQGSAGTLIRLDLEGLAPGKKAVHIHGTGTCEDHQHGFQESGGHLNPDERQHGLLNPDGPDAGDLPNFHVDTDGSAWVEFHTTAASLDGSFGAQILGEDGAALVIHENPDDHVSQPIGGAGSRIACGVIKAAD